MSIYTDQLGNKVQLPKIPERIISLVPSQTELLFDLGLNVEVVGITKYCIHPKEKMEQFKNANALVGGTKKLNLERIRQLNPDLIIGNKEENERSHIEELQKEFPVWISDIQTLPQAYEMIRQIGILTGRKEKAIELIKQIEDSFAQLKSIPKGKTVLYLIWRKPYIAVGTDTFINYLLDKCGLINAINSLRYPELNTNDLQKANPDYIFLSSEPYPFREKHIAEFKTLSPGSQIVLVDGEMFSWYGSRLLHFQKYFNTLLLSLN